MWFSPSATDHAASVPPPAVTGISLLFLLGLGLVAGALALFRRRLGPTLSGFGGGGGRSRAERRLAVVERRMLGNRQFLVVADYAGQRVLLGVTPGQINFLCPLSSPSAQAPGTPTTAADPTGFQNLLPAEKEEGTPR